MDVLFATSPFKERRQDFNVWGLVPAARESGISRPSLGQHRANPVGSTYDAFGSERYVLTFDNRAFRQIASYAPYDVVEIVVNGRTYGGGGIYNLYSTVAADNAFAPYVFVHEFGHHFAALADEYYTSPVAYLPAATREEPWEPNVTALLDPATLKWKDLVAAVNAPADAVGEGRLRDRARGDAGDARGAARRRSGRRPRWKRSSRASAGRTTRSSRPSATPARPAPSRARSTRRAATTGRRPTASCSRAPTHFCEVCRRALHAVIDTYVK